MNGFVNMLRGVFGEPRHNAQPARQKPRPQLAVEELEGRVVPSLTPISPNAGYPYSAIAEIQVTFPDHHSFVGSGVLVDNFHVLTAGHVLYHSADGGYASTIKVVPDLNNGSEPFGYAMGSFSRTYDEFRNYDKAHPGVTAPGDYDIGLITLDRSIGKRTGALPFGYNNDNRAFAPNLIFNTAGYPAAGGYTGQQMEFSSGPIAGLTPDGSTIQFKQSAITIFGGSSGSPLYAKFANGDRVVEGVVVGGYGTANSVNSATRITQKIFNDFEAAIKSDRVPGDFVSKDPVGNTFVSTGSSGTVVTTFLDQAVATSSTLAGPTTGHGNLDGAAHPATATDIFFTAVARTDVVGQNQAAQKETNGTDLTPATDVILPGTRKTAEGLDRQMTRAGGDQFWGSEGLDLASWLTVKM